MTCNATGKVGAGTRHGRALGAFGWAIAAVVASSCGGGGSPPPETAATTPEPTGPVNATGGREVSADVGPDGGTLSLEGGATLVIAPGALGETVSVSMSTVDQSQTIDMHADQEGVGPALLIHPAMVSATEPFELSVPYLTLPAGYTRDDLALATEEEHHEQRAMGMGGMQTRWHMNPARIDGDRIVGRLDELVGHRVQFVVAR